MVYRSKRHRDSLSASSAGRSTLWLLLVAVPLGQPVMEGQNQKIFGCGVLAWKATPISILLDKHYT